MSILFVNRSAPYGKSLAKESLDAVLAGAAFEQHIQLLFMGDGVFQLLKEQDSQALSQKNQSSMLAVLEMYDVSDIYVQAEALNKRFLNEDDLCIKVKVLSNSDAAKLIAHQNTVLSF